MRKIIQMTINVVFLMVAFVAVASAEEVTVSTYYPSPVGNYRNLTVSNNATVNNNLTATNLTVTGASNLSTITTTPTTGNVTVGGTLAVTGTSTFTGAVTAGAVTAGALIATTVTSNGQIRANVGSAGNLVQSCSGGNCYTYAVYS